MPRNKKTKKSEDINKKVDKAIEVGKREFERNKKNNPALWEKIKKYYNLDDDWSIF